MQATSPYGQADYATKWYDATEIEIKKLRAAVLDALTDVVKRFAKNGKAKQISNTDLILSLTCLNVNHFIRVSDAAAKYGRWTPIQTMHVLDSVHRPGVEGLLAPTYCGTLLRARRLPDKRPISNAHPPLNYATGGRHEIISGAAVAGKLSSAVTIRVLDCIPHTAEYRCDSYVVVGLISEETIVGTRLPLDPAHDADAREDEESDIDDGSIVPDFSSIFQPTHSPAPIAAKAAKVRERASEVADPLDTSSPVDPDAPGRHWLMEALEEVEDLNTESVQGVLRHEAFVTGMTESFERFVGN